jgi:hypothetical protein
MPISRHDTEHSVNELLEDIEKNFPNDRSAKTLVGIALAHEVVIRAKVHKDMKLDAMMLLLEFTHRELLMLALQDIMTETKKHGIADKRVIPLSMCTESLQWCEKRKAHMSRLQNLIDHMVDATEGNPE